MKHLKLFAALCCTAVLFAACTPTTGTENGHEYVDLGLPSGTKWATCNVGANSPEAYGDYFAWGEITTKDKYSGNTYKWGTAAYNTIFKNWDLETLTKYNGTDGSYGAVDNKTTLDPEDDAAAVNWGGKWRMPTNAEWEELENNCTWIWTTMNGLNGYRVTSKTNGNSIFLPAAGYRYNADLNSTGDKGCYWSSSLGRGAPYFACYAEFSLKNVVVNPLFGVAFRYSGNSVRPVFK